MSLMYSDVDLFAVSEPLSTLAAPRTCRRAPRGASPRGWRAPRPRPSKCGEVKRPLLATARVPSPGFFPIGRDVGAVQGPRRRQAGLQRGRPRGQQARPRRARRTRETRRVRPMDVRWWACGSRTLGRRASTFRQWSSADSMAVRSRDARFANGLTSCSHYNLCCRGGERRR